MKLNFSKKTILITGCAGFIGMHLAKKLLSHNCKVVGIDNLNEYYDVRLKLNRLSVLKNMMISYSKN